ncbi:hypothetical protein ACE186_23430, partial [Escherichia fergusonii]
EWWEKQKGSRGIRRGQWYRLVFQFPIRELTMDEWLCAVSCITSRRVYLQRTAVAGVPRYGLDGHPKGQVSDSEAQSAGRRLATLEQKWLRMQAQQENISGQ